VYKKFIFLLAFCTCCTPSLARDLELQEPLCYASLALCQKDIPDNYECCSRIITSVDEEILVCDIGYKLSLVGKCEKQISSNTSTKLVYSESKAGYVTQTTTSIVTEKCDPDSIKQEGSPETCYYRQQRPNNNSQISACFVEGFETIK
jgi:hypothetical protein